MSTMELDEDRTDVYSSGDDGSSMVMSERVKALAASIYGEFEAMIQKYDQDVVSELMPIIVSVLEQLDASYGDSHEQNLELEMLQDDNEQLMNQYEREKQLRKLAENKYLEMEDQIEQEYREKQNLLENTEHQNRQLEAKVKNYQDHIERLDERIAEMKREYNALHQRHAEMVHHYMERIERAEKGKFSPAHPGDNSLFKAGRHRTLSSSTAGSKSDTVLLTPTGHKEEGMTLDESQQALDKHQQLVNKNKLSLKDESKLLLEDEKMEVTSTTDEKGSDSAVCVATSTTNLIHDTSSESSIEKSQEDTTATCKVTDIDHMSIMNSQEAADMLSPTKKAWSTDLSSDAQAIVASTPELLTQTEVPLRSNRAKERPISLDLESLPEGVNAESLFAELSNEDAELIQELDEGADITAMGKELEILMTDNKELLAAKSKLITQKTDLLKRLEEISSEKEVLKDEVSSIQAMKGRMNYRISELEQEVKMLKHENDKAQVALKEANVSAAHRKRFTRVEMARVLMERNQYKERLMELQEAVRWTEMIRASKEKNLEMQRKKKSGVWKFFNSLFSASPDKKPTSSSVSIRYNSPGPQDVTDAPMQRRQTYTGYGLERQRLMEKRERYKQVRAAHLNTAPSSSGLGENRLQAYGWSLPATYSSESVESGGKNLISVPVPVYCRPLNINEPGMKIWCAAGVDLTGGRTRDGVASIGGSVLYADSNRDGVDEPEAKEAKASIVWIGSSTHSCSKVTIIDANCPQKILDCFVVCTTHLLCIASVPGASESDYEISSDSPQGVSSTETPVSGAPGSTPAAVGESGSNDGTTSATVMGVSGEDVGTGNETGSGMAEKMSSVLPTMWLGAQSGCVYVHSAVSQWRACIHSIRLKDSVLSIVHVKGRVLAALADGTIAIFHRSQDGQWDFSNYHLLDLGRPHHSIRCMAVVYEKVWCGYRNKIQVIHPRTMKIEKTFDAHPRRESQVRQLAWIGDGVWVSIRLDSTLRLYNAHTYHHLQDIDIEPYVSKMLGTGKLGFSFVRITALLLTNDRLWVGTGNGVILSVPLVAAIPARDTGETKPSPSTDRPASPALTGPGGAVRVYSNGSRDGDTPSASFMPYCSMVNAQLSFHGHKDSVKFFVCVPGSVKPPSSLRRPSTTGDEQLSLPSVDSQSSASIKQNSLVLSGGEGYIDFRTSENNEDGVDDDRNSDDFIAAQSKAQTTSEKSHLMVWQVAII